MCCRRRERYVMGGERKVNKISQNIFGIDVHTVSYLRWYCSGMTKFLRFGIPNEDWFLVFGMPNAKYLAPDGSALKKVNFQIASITLFLGTPKESNKGEKNI